MVANKASLDALPDCSARALWASVVKAQHDLFRHSVASPFAPLDADLLERSLDIPLSTPTER
eukprot:10868370-Alexandrium_andersonii.AAC.1